ncbi:MAG: hypothetical protein IJ685_10380 [Selenomonadaceae bacterium]|nr:hypothetical protein [Selenomonadaceae bacterium]
MIEETMIHPETGELLRRDVRPIEFNYKGEKIIMDMPGWYPPEGDDGIFSMDDMAVHDKALRILKARHAEKLRENNFELDNAALA